MKRDWMLAVGSTLLTLLAALVAVRLLSPKLLGVPIDLQLVHIDKSRVPFFDLVFAQEGIGSNQLDVPDPMTVRRGTALLPDLVSYGPHDLLGFRNAAIPNVTDVIVVGDSQTYGAGVTFGESWPQVLSQLLSRSGRVSSVYTMALGGWSAPQYLYVLGGAHKFSPRAVVVAFYSGNDPLETFMQVYGMPHWERLRQTGLNAKSAPTATFPAPKEEQWRVDFPGDRWLHFTPKVRHINSMRDAAADEGWRLLAEMAKEMQASARSADIDLYFTIIPTRETAYAPYLKSLEIEPRADFAAQSRMRLLESAISHNCLPN